MRLIFILLAVLLAGCDTDADMPIREADLAVLTSACTRNGGLLSAERALPAFSGSWEWRLSCKDGARFVVPIRYSKG